ncbi:hypothetical protein B0H12DRAFT_1235229 [Mycena haematopus]|nr:hypothetical protein B0H12DRAFT_1235229 [Mycena haematopus]
MAEEIDTWTEDRSQPNPYCLAGGKSAGPSEAAVFLELKNAEAAEAAEGRAPIMKRQTASAFIKAGLQLEEAQRRIKAEFKSFGSRYCAQAQNLREATEHVHARRCRVARGGRDLRDPEIPPPKVEDIKLWMPSELSDTARRAACSRGLSEIEAKVGAVNSHLIMWRNSNSTGQRAATRSATLIGRAQILRRNSRSCVSRIWTTTLEAESDEVARRKLNRLGSSKRARNEPSIKKATMCGSGRRVEDLVKTRSNYARLRVEWSKTKARRDRWEEEVMILREEMRRVLRMLPVAAGLKAYAACQVRSVATAVRDVMRQDGTVYRDLLEGVADDEPALGLEGVEEAVAEETAG